MVARSLLFASLLILVSLTSCKGRRASDMVPSGDTVEVVVNHESPVSHDSIPQDEEPRNEEMPADSLRN